MTEESYHYRDPDDTHRPDNDDGTLMASPEWVVNTVRALTAEPTEDVGVMDLLTHKQAVIQEAKKCGIPPANAREALEDTIRQDRIFSAPQQGHLAPMSDEHLLAVLKAEDASPRTRPEFVAKCNAARATLRELEGQAADPLEVADD